MESVAKGIEDKIDAQKPDVLPTELADSLKKKSTFDTGAAEQILQDR